MATDLGKLMPGYDFLQGLMKNAGAALPGLPGMSSWIAPTLDPAELDKRIQDLKTVQFWLEQNARLMGTTIQALEVQRMTLAALQTMNLPLTELRRAFEADVPAAAPSPAAADGSENGAEDDDRAPPEPAAADAAAGPDASAAPPPAAPPAIDPLRWWGALTQQFTELAAKAVQDTAAEASRQRAAAAADVAAPAPRPGRPPRAAAKAAAASAPAAPAGAARAPAARKRGR